MEAAVNPGSLFSIPVVDGWIIFFFLSFSFSAITGSKSSMRIFEGGIVGNGREFDSGGYLKNSFQKNFDELIILRSSTFVKS